MLTIKTSEGKELITLHDNGNEEIKDQKLKEQMEQASINESKE